MRVRSYGGPAHISIACAISLALVGGIIFGTIGSICGAIGGFLFGWIMDRSYNL